MSVQAREHGIESKFQAWSLRGGGGGGGTFRIQWTG
jgi:hypothetical protein